MTTPAPETSAPRSSTAPWGLFLLALIVVIPVAFLAGAFAAQWHQPAAQDEKQGNTTTPGTSGEKVLEPRPVQAPSVPPARPGLAIAVLDFTIEPKAAVGFWSSSARLQTLRESRQTLCDHLLQGSDFLLPPADRLATVKGMRDPREAGKKLGVAHVVDPRLVGISKEQTAVRITLVDVPSGAEMWRNEVRISRSTTDQSVIVQTLLDAMREAAEGIKGRLRMSSSTTRPVDSVALAAELRKTLAKELTSELTQALRSSEMETLAAQMRPLVEGMFRRHADEVTRAIDKALAPGAIRQVWLEPGHTPTGTIVVTTTTYGGSRSTLNAFYPNYVRQSLAGEVLHGTNLRVPDEAQLLTWEKNLDPLQVGKAAKARWVLTTRYLDAAATGYSLHARLLDVATGEELYRTAVAATDEDRSKKGPIDRMARQIAEGVKLRLALLAGAEARERKTIGDALAVLPFRLPDGLHDGVRIAVTNWITELPDLLLREGRVRVVPARRVQALPGRKTPAEVGRALGAGVVLSGRVVVEDEGARLIIEAELIDIDNDLVLWADRWELSEVLQKMAFLERVRGEIAARVSKRLSTPR